MPTDLLLLNASNKGDLPIFPYAFIQVTAVAGRFGLSVKREDLLFTPETQWSAKVGELIKRHQPRMVGVHLRQPDSLAIHDYLPLMKRGEYRPADATRILIRQLRTLTQVPIIVGGHGFTNDADALFDYVQADFGVRGDPDGVFQHFEQLCRRERLAEIPNLMYRENGATASTPRQFFPGPPEREYDVPLTKEIVAFYRKAKRLRLGHEPVNRRSEICVAVELARGCPAKCYFCAEPNVKGTAVRVRDLDVVFAEIRFLLDQGFRSFWLVCSEANYTSPNFGTPSLLERVAQRMAALRKEYPSPRKLEWSSYILPLGISKDLFPLLDASGFTWSWNEIQSLDDDNLQQAKVPYRTTHAGRFLREFFEHQDHVLRQELEADRPSTEGRSGERRLSIEEDILVRAAVFQRRLSRDDRAFRTRARLGQLPGLGIFRRGALMQALMKMVGTYSIDNFLFNPYSTRQTIRKTLLEMSRLGLEKYAFSSQSMFALRVFGSLKQHKGFTVDSFDAPELFDNASPTTASFHLNPEFRKVAGGPYDMFLLSQHLGGTFFSRQHRITKTWASFLAENTTPAALAGWLETALEARVDVPFLDLGPRELGFLEKRIRKALTRPVAGARLSPFFRSTHLLQNPERLDLFDINFLPFSLVETVHRGFEKTMVPVLDYLRIPHDGAGRLSLSEFEFLSPLVGRYVRKADVVRDVQSKLALAPSSIEVFLLKKVLFEYNVQLDPPIIDLLFGTDPERRAAGTEEPKLAGSIGGGLSASPAAAPR